MRELFRVKYDNILGKWICKVRIVARGDLEESEEFVYAPVANMVALRIFVILSLEFGVDFRQLDIASAFLCEKVSDQYLLNYLKDILKKMVVQLSGRHTVLFMDLQKHHAFGMQRLMTFSRSLVYVFGLQKLLVCEEN